MANSPDVGAPTPDPPTLDERVDALQLRVALLEAAFGRANDTTIADLPEATVASMLGTNPANLGAYTQAAKEQRQQAREGILSG